MNKDIIEVFNSRPNLERLYTNKKGEIFTEKYLAINSEKGNEKAVKTHERPKGEIPKVETSIEETRESIMDLDITELEALLKKEKANKNIPLVNLIEDRLKELIKKLESNGKS